MENIKNWEKLTDYERDLAMEMVKYLENGGELFMVCTNISKNGMTSRFMVFLTVGDKNILFKYSIIQKLKNLKTSGAKTFKINGCGIDRGLEVLEVIKDTLNIKNKQQNYSCYYED